MSGCYCGRSPNSVLERASLPFCPTTGCRPSPGPTSGVVRQALAEYVARVEEEDDIQFADAQRIADGAPTYDME